MYQRERGAAEEEDTLQHYALLGVRETGVEIGRGSYAVVHAIEYRGLKCAAKEFHRLLYESGMEESARRFKQECALLSQLRHPNVVQFLGVYYFQPDLLPALVMEYLPMTLAQCLDVYGVLPNEINYSILTDVALALCYLHNHSPPVLHRDLSANNVLLTAGMTAKVSDFGVSKMLVDPARIALTMTQTPGNQCYMPPEALVPRPHYNTKVDVFSYAVLMIHLFSGSWPFPMEAVKVDPKDKNHMIPQTEADRRQKELDVIGRDHPLISLILDCLHNHSDHRPEANKILERLTQVAARFPSSAKNKVELLRQLESLKSTDTLLAEINSLRSDNEKLKEKVLKYESSHRSVGDLKKKMNVLKLTLPHEQTGSTIPQIEWEKCDEIPKGMSCAQAVVINETTVYVGGGFASETMHVYVIYEYNANEDKWRFLPYAPVRWFGMGELRGQLVLVGGKTMENEVTGKVHSIDVAGNSYEKRWKECIRPMPTARHNLTVFSQLSCLAVVGGRNLHGVRLPDVEVFVEATSQWHKTSPAPFGLSEMTTTVLHNKFLLSEYHSSRILQLCVSVDQESTFDSRVTTEWVELPERLHNWAALSHANGCLLSFGGKNITGESLDTVYMFSPIKMSWNKIGILPEPRCNCTIVLSNNKFLVIGGERNLASGTVTLKKVRKGLLTGY